MRTVIYTKDFEPIVLIEASPFMLEELERRKSVSIPVLRPLQSSDEWDYAPADRMEDIRYVRLDAEVLLRNGRKTMILFASDEKTELLLKSAFLPGEQRVVRDEKIAAFAQGFLEAVSRGVCGP